jgi:hypothetical protein
MLRFAQIRSAVEDRPSEWFLHLLGCVFLLTALAGIGLVGVLIAFVAIGLFSRYFLSHIRRTPRFKLREIGEIEMDLPARNTGDMSWLAFGSFNILVAYYAYRNRWQRLLITNRGLYQVLDVTSPWPTYRRRAQFAAAGHTNLLLGAARTVSLEPAKWGTGSARERSSARDRRAATPFVPIASDFGRGQGKA